MVAILKYSSSKRTHFGILLVFLSLLCSYARAEDLIVTSNADTGSGTLREALSTAAANGDALADHILFNLSGTSEADLTIFVATQLPLLSSNLTIDGTSQPGNPLQGTIDSRVLIKSTRQFKNHFAIFKGTGLRDIAIYGLLFWDTNIFGLSDPDGPDRYAIQLTNSERISIGRKNKANWFDGYNRFSIDLLNCRAVSIVANSFLRRAGNNDYGGTAPIHLSKVIGLTFGESGAGNVIFGGVYIELQNATEESKLVFTDNNFAVMADGVTTMHVGGSTVKIQGLAVLDSDPKSLVDISFTGNLFSHFATSGIDLRYLTGKASIKRNWLGTDRAAKLPLNRQKAHPGDGRAILVQQFDGDVVVGDQDPAQGNVIAYVDYGVTSENVTNLLLMRNSFKCIGETEYYHGNQIIPVTKVTTSTASSIQGTASPGATVDVFLSDNCTKCSPEQFLGSTLADANGAWEYSFTQPVAGYVIANSHLGKKSSTFSKTSLSATSVKIEHIKCGNKGSIRGIQVSNTTTVKWINKAGNVVSNSTDLLDVPPGEYKLIAGTNCPVESGFWEIRDLSIRLNDATRKIQQPSCNMQDGSVSGINIINPDPADLLTYRWTDSQQKIVASALALSGVGPGSYLLTITSLSGCQITYGPIILAVPGGPEIDQSAVSIEPSACQGSTGAIRGLQAKGSGTLSYQWKNAQQEIVALTKDLLNVAAGTYVLQLTDNSGCGSVYASIVVPETNGIAIDDTRAQLTHASCGLSDGAIGGIIVIGANRYTWRNHAGTILSSTLLLENIPAGKLEIPVILTT